MAYRHPPWYYWTHRVFKTISIGADDSMSVFTELPAVESVMSTSDDSDGEESDSEERNSAGP